MSKYASLLFSPEKYHEIGPFRFPVYHDLVPGEAKGMEQISRQQSKSTFRSIKLAQRIAKDKGITTKEAIKLLSKVGEKEAEDILFDYGSEIEDLQTSNITVVEQQVAFVTLFMKYRAEAKLKGKNDWQKLTDWCQEDTEAMPTKVMTDVFQLISWERDGWPNPDDAGKAQDSEEEPQFSPPPTKS